MADAGYASGSMIHTSWQDSPVTIHPQHSGSAGGDVIDISPSSLVGAEDVDEARGKLSDQQSSGDEPRYLYLLRAACSRSGFEFLDGGDR